MSMINLSASVGPMDVSRAARSSGFSGFDSRASVVRYSILRLAGKTHDQAMHLCKPEPVPGMVVTGGSIRVPIEEEYITEASKNLPSGTSRATVIRYALFRAAGYEHDEALDEASRPITGRPKGATDKSPRHRRTKAELTAANQAAET